MYGLVFESSAKLFFLFLVASWNMPLVADLHLNAIKSATGPQLSELFHYWGGNYNYMEMGDQVGLLSINTHGSMHCLYD